MDNLITTKLAPPATVGLTVARGYAMDRLLQTRSGHATLIVAPAGYGKSELLSRWYHRCRDEGFRVGWVSLEPEDAPIEVFLGYALAALGQPVAGTGTAMPPTRRAAVSRLLAATLADERHTLLFLDDYDRLGGELDDLVRLLVERAAPRLHLVIGSRVQPEIGLAELHAKGLVTELGPADLRLGFREALALVTSGRRSVTQGDIALLLQRTEGWPIALRMAGDFVQSHPDAAAPLTAFSGRRDDLANYLYEAILSTLAPDEQHALLALACVPRVCGDLLNELAGRRDGGALLQRFARRNVLLSRLDDEGQWYRLHQLLAEFLLARLAQEDADAPREIHRRAADWFGARQLLPEALRAAAAADDEVRLARLLDRAGGWRLTVDGRIGLLRANLGSINDATLLSFPRLAMARPILLAKSAARSQAGAWIEKIRQASEGFTNARNSATTNFDAAQLTREAPMLSIIVGWYLDEAPAGGFTTEIAELLEGLDAATDPLLVGSAGNICAYELACMRRHDAAWQAAQQALAAIENAGFPDQEIYLRFIEAGLLIERARLPDAQTLLQQLHGRAERDCGVGSDLAAIAEVLLARVQTLKGDAASATELLERSMAQVLEQDTWFDIAWAGHAAAAGVAMLAGDEAAAVAAIEKGLATAERCRLRRLGARLQTYRIDRLLAQGSIQHALDLIEALDLDALEARFADTDRRVSDAAVLTSARAALAHASVAAGDASSITPLVADLAEHIERWLAEGSVLQTIEALLLLAAAENARGLPSGCAHALDRALGLALPGHVLQPFVEHGRPLIDAFERALVRAGGRGAPNLRARFLSTVQDSLRRLASPPARRRQQTLSPREAEIAAALARGLSNKLIARELGLSEGTVKFHLRNLYTKLGAHSRDDVLRLIT
jgi:LuxR family transcriptional regulator, maltose regulon positive regulatory protein